MTAAGIILFVLLLAFAVSMYRMGREQDRLLAEAEQHEQDAPPIAWETWRAP